MDSLHIESIELWKIIEITSHYVIVEMRVQYVNRLRGAVNEFLLTMTLNSENTGISGSFKQLTARQIESLMKNALSAVLPQLASACSPVELP